MDGQYRDLLSENDRTKRETFGLKERLLAAESEIKTLQMTLEKTQINIDQAAEALSRTEGALEVYFSFNKPTHLIPKQRERRINADLRAQLAAEARNNNQWETNQSYDKKDYSSNRREEGSRQFDEPPQQQSYSRQERQEPVTQSRPQNNQFQPTKYEQQSQQRRPYTAQPPVEEPQQQRQRYQEPVQNEQPRYQEPQNRTRQQQNYNQPDPYQSDRFGTQNKNQRGGFGNNEPQEPYQQPPRQLFYRINQINDFEIERIDMMKDQLKVLKEINHKMKIHIIEMLL